MKKGIKVSEIIALMVIITFSAAAHIEAQENVSNQEEENTAVLSRVEEKAFIDNGERFISFDWSGVKDNVYSRKLTKDSYVEYIKNNDNYSLIIYAKSDDGASNIQLIAIGTSDSGWKNRNFVYSVKLVDTTMMSIHSETITILDDGKESGLFRAVFDGVYCIENKYHTTLTNGIIQVNVKK